MDGVLQPRRQQSRQGCLVELPIVLVVGPQDLLEPSADGQESGGGCGAPWCRSLSQDCEVGKARSANRTSILAGNTHNPKRVDKHSAVLLDGGKATSRTPTLEWLRSQRRTLCDGQEVIRSERRGDDERYWQGQPFSWLLQVFLEIVTQGQSYAPTGRKWKRVKEKNYSSEQRTGATIIQLASRQQSVLHFHVSVGTECSDFVVSSASTLTVPARPRLAHTIIFRSWRRPVTMTTQWVVTFTVCIMLVRLTGDPSGSSGSREKETHFVSFLEVSCGHIDGKTKNSHHLCSNRGSDIIHIHDTGGWTRGTAHGCQRGVASWTGVPRCRSYANTGEQRTGAETEHGRSYDITFKIAAVTKLISNIFDQGNRDPWGQRWRFTSANLPATCRDHGTLFPNC